MLTLHPGTMQLPNDRVRLRGLDAWLRSNARHTVRPVGGAAEAEVMFERRDCDPEKQGLLGGQKELVTVRLGWVGGIMGGTLILVSLLAVCVVVFMLVFAQMAAGMIADAQTAFVPTGMKLLDSVDTIADNLAVRVSTVRKHRENIMAKLGLNSTAQLVRAAMQIGQY